ncbi:hypothetical protein MNB_SV-12-106 [hydrothermal vent metagenome]|uniref:Porin domain-containing protein n=1 Tax=hydrothermal vent metagenome TaxID=652676 RepID=A0A1W1BDT4_9ZZZZ
MKKTIYKISTAVALVLLSTGNLSAFDIKGKSGEQNTKLQIFGFGQLEARGGDGVIGDEQDASVKFGAQRVRLGWKYSAGKVKGKVFLDFNQAHNDKSGVGMPNMVKDAFVTYIPHKAMAVKVGLIKMPLGFGFTTPGWNLDVVERGFDKQLAFERGMGIMLSGRDLGFGNSGKVNGFEMGHERPWKGFGYDIMIANQAGRSGSVTNAKSGDANSYVARVSFDWTELFHTELSYGISEKAGGIANGKDILTDTKAYKALNFGIDSHFGNGANVKLEYFDAQNLRGSADWDESTISLTGTYYVTDTLELATKHIQGTSDKNGVETDLGNTYIGFNYYLEPANNKMSRMARKKRNAHRVQVNYVLANGDTDEWNGLKGYRDDAILAQYQFKF